MKRTTVGGRAIKDLRRVKRRILLEKVEGKGYSLGLRKGTRSGASYLLLPVRFREALTLLGVNVERARLPNKPIRATITCNEAGDEFYVEYMFKKEET